MNNFQKLQEQQERAYHEGHDGEELKKDLLGTLSTFRFIGSVIDVYLPRVVDMFIAIAGGSDEQESSKAGPRDPASGRLGPEKGKGPGDSGNLPPMR